MAEDHKFILLQNADGVKLFPRIDLGNTNATLLPMAKVDGLADALAGKAAAATTIAGYGITDAYTKDEINSLIDASNFEYLVVDALPTTADASTMYKIYFVKRTDNKGTAEDKDIYDEFITVRTGAEGAYTYAWEKIGDTAIDLSSKADVADTLAGYGITDAYTKEQVDEELGKKLDASVIDSYSTTAQVESKIATAKTEITGGSTKTISTLDGEVATKAEKTYVDGIVGADGTLTQRVTATEGVANGAAAAVATKAEKAYVDGEFKTAISGEIDADVKAAKDAIDAYTINSKKISDSPTLSGNDIALGTYDVEDSALSFTAGTTVTDAFEAIDTQFKNLVGGGEGGEGGEGGLNLTGINIRLTAAEGDIDDIEAALEGLLTAGAVQSALDLKANKADVDAIIGENGSLTQTVALKANASDVDAKIGDEGTITKAVAANTQAIAGFGNAVALSFIYCDADGNEVTE